MFVLNVAEKNDAAKNIANILSRGSMQRRDGPSKYNKNYEFEFDFPGRGRAQMLFTSVSGHLLQQDFIGEHRNWRSKDPLALFDAPVLSFCSPDNQPVLNNILAGVRRASLLIIWTDCDREGENIGFEVIGECMKVKPNLEVKRARFSEITRNSVFSAINNLVEPDVRQSEAVDVRKELDLRIGAAFTRIQTMSFQKHLSLDGIVSYGSCQFPTLGFVVQRYKEREQFVSEPFYYVEAAHKLEGVVTKFKWAKNRTFDMFECFDVYEKLMRNPEATVVAVEEKRKTKCRPEPMDTIRLEKLASQKLKINAKETMRIAEHLYSSGQLVALS